MKNDAVSRKRMGNEGCKAVNSRSVKYVVADLLQWYERGRQTALRRRGQLFYRVLVPATLMLLVPFTIGIFCFYNITVRSTGVGIVYGTELN